MAAPYRPIPSGSRDVYQQQEQARRLAERSENETEDTSLIDVFSEMHNAKPTHSSPQRNKLAKLLTAAKLTEFKPGDIPKFRSEGTEPKPRALVFSPEGADAARKSNVISRRLRLLRQDEARVKHLREQETPMPPATSPQKPREEVTKDPSVEALSCKKATLHTHRANIKTFEAHVGTILTGSKSVKVDYFNFLNILIRDKHLGEPIDFVKFSSFYTKLTELVKLLRADQLDEYVLRHSTEAQSADEPSVADKIQELSKGVVADLVSFGFRAPAGDGKIIFWSGSLAKAKAMEDDSGLTDEQIELLQALWGFDSLVSKKEKQKPSYTKDGSVNSIHTKLIVAFSSILAEYAEGKETVYLLGYPDGELNVSSAYWKGEAPVLMKLAKKLDFWFYNNQTKAWEGPFDLKDPEQAKVLDRLKITRRDYGGERGPKRSDTRITVGDAKMMVQKWKWYTAIENYMRQLPESSC